MPKTPHPVAPPRPMYGVEKWWPIGGSGTHHYLTAASTPGDFHFACGRTSKGISPRDRKFSDGTSHCQTCEKALAQPEGDLQ